jgi:hypothetical protein
LPGIYSCFHADYSFINIAFSQAHCITATFDAITSAFTCASEDYSWAFRFK